MKHTEAVGFHLANSLAKRLQTHDDPSLSLAVRWRGLGSEERKGSYR